MLAAALLCSSGLAQGAAILEVASDSLTTYLPSGATAVQDIRPLANQRGVNLDGSLRAGSRWTTCPARSRPKKAPGTARRSPRERTYYAQNWRGDVVALLDNTGGRKETIRYSAYGTPFGMPAADANGSGTVNVSDFFVISGAFGESYGDPSYSVLADINLDGTVNASDSTIHSGQSGHSLGHGNLSRSPSLSGGVGNRLGYAGYAWEPVSSKYHVRHRVLDPLRGRWSRRDPLGYVDAPTLFAYVGNRAMTGIDPTGMFSEIHPCARRGVYGDCINQQWATQVPLYGGWEDDGGGGAGQSLPPPPITLPPCVPAEEVTDGVRDAWQAVWDACGQDISKMPTIICKSPADDNGDPKKNPCATGKACGVYNQRTREMIICDPAPMHCSGLSGRLIHELTHARQLCDNPDVFTDMETTMCAEIEAYVAQGIFEDAAGTDRLFVCYAACDSTAKRFNGKYPKGSRDACVVDCLMKSDESCWN